jgi:hypothetical protein
VGVVPPDRKTEFMALYYASAGVIGGIGQLSAGYLLDYTARLSGNLWLIRLDSYTVLFCAAIVLPIVGGLLLRNVRADAHVAETDYAEAR